MKSLIAAFALLSFVGASTVTMIVPAQAVTHHPKKKHAKHVGHVAAHHKKVGGSKMKKPAAA